MEIKIISTVEALEQLRPFWEEVQWHPGADYEFFKVILRSRSEILSPCVLAAYENGCPVALLAGRLEQSTMPVSLGYATLFRIPMRQIVFIEGGFMGRRTPAAWQSFMEHMPAVFQSLSPRRIVLEQIRSESEELGVLRSLFSPLRLGAMSADAEHWRMRLPGNWEEFLKARSKKHRYWLKRLDSMLDRDFANQWSIKRYESQGDVPSFGEAAEQIARKTYQRGLGVGFHLKSETVDRMLNEARLGQLAGYVLFIRDEPKAFWHCAVSRDVLYLASTGYDPAYRPYEIGTVLLMRVFKDHCGSKVDHVDFGLGSAGYKQRFGTESYFEASRCIYAKSPVGVALNLFQRLGVFGFGLAKRLLARLHVIQSLKTMWRRKIERRVDGGADAPEAKTSAVPHSPAKPPSPECPPNAPKNATVVPP